MRKHLLSLFAMASMLLASSCSQEEVISQSTGDEVKVTFTTELRNDAKSRAVGDDTKKIDKLVFAVYDETGAEIRALRQTTHPVATTDTQISLKEENGKKTAEINLVLVKGQTYSFAFWAQCDGYDAYSFDPATGEVTIDYAKCCTNKPEADAFFKGIEPTKVTGTFEQNVTLKRPFAQVNFLTTGDDLNNAAKAGFVPSSSSITIKNVAKTLNVVTGEVKDIEDAEVTFESAGWLKDETTGLNEIDGNYFYLATAYFLPTDKAAETKITASMSVKATVDTKGLIELTAPDIAAQRNYRTNIYGNLLTSNGKFNVSIDPDFDGNHNVEISEFTETYESLQGALNENAVKTEALTYNIESSTGANLRSVGVEIPEDTKASSLTFNFEDLADDAQITISNAQGGNYAKPVVIEVPEGVSLNQIEVKLPNAHVTLKQGNYTEVISSTSNTTLVVSAGTTIETLQVVKGNVRIEKGGNVEEIVRSEDPKNEDDVTYVIYEGELPTETNSDPKIIYVSAAVFDSFVGTDGIYEINSLEGLKTFRDAVNGGETFKGKTIKLIADIDLNNEEWTPIGNSTNIFQGTFDGQYHTISNLLINGGSSSNQGLFGFTTDGEIKNLTVNNAKVSGRLNVAVVAGTPYTSKYTNIKVTGHVEVNGMAYVGGVGGKNAYANWTDITVDVDASSYVNANSVENGSAYRTYVGGVVGFNGEGGHSFINITSNIYVKGSTCDVGGLFGIAHYGNKFENCICTGEVEIYAAEEESDAQEIGGIAGVWHPGGEDVVMKNCKFTGTLKANYGFKIYSEKFGDLVCSAYDTTGKGKLIIDGVSYRANTTTVSTAVELVAALAAGNDVKFLNDITVAATKGGYNKAGILQNKAQTIDGNGYTLTVTGAGATWDCAIYTNGGTIKNLTVAGAMRGIFTAGQSSDLYIDNVVFKKVIYTFNSDGEMPANPFGVYVSNSNVNGWTSHSDMHTEVVYTNCSFGEGSGYKFCRPYGKTGFVNCTFCADYTVDESQTNEITFTDCTFEE